MQHELEITSAEQAKVLANPLRLQIISIFGDALPRTSKQLADVLDLAPAKVHYHVRELLRAGILQLVETKEKGGIVEKYYLPVARRFKVNLNDTGTDVEGITSTRQMFLKSILDDFQSSFLQAQEIAQQRKAEQKALTTGVNKEINGPILSHSHIFLSDEEAKQLRKELDELFTRWTEKRKQSIADEQVDGKSYGILLSLYEKSPKNRLKGTTVID